MVCANVALAFVKKTGEVQRANVNYRPTLVLYQMQLMEKSVLVEGYANVVLANATVQTKSDILVVFVKSARYVCNYV